MCPAKNYKNYEEYRREHESFLRLLCAYFGPAKRVTTTRRIDNKDGWLYLSDVYTGDFLPVRIWSNIALTPTSYLHKPFIHVPFLYADYLTYNNHSLRG